MNTNCICLTQKQKRKKRKQKKPTNVPREGAGSRQQVRWLDGMFPEKHIKL